MERKEFARKVARSQNLPIARAQDQVDELVDQIISQLSEPASSPSSPVAEVTGISSRARVAVTRAAAARISKSRGAKP